jgi:signal transduction histidine kinase
MKIRSVRPASPRPRGAIGSKRASRATVALACPDGHLEFTVADDGVGFDAVTATAGTGLQGMADHLAAAGGSLLVRSAPGTGTTIHGRLPV